MRLTTLVTRLRESRVRSCARAADLACDSSKSQALAAGRSAVRRRCIARAGREEGWQALALLSVVLTDAVTRSTLAGFPLAYLAFLLIGLALAHPVAYRRADRASVA